MLDSWGALHELFYSVFIVVSKSSSDRSAVRASGSQLGVVHTYPLSPRALQWQAQRRGQISGQSSSPNTSAGKVAVFGSFDGIHLGHQSLVRHALVCASQSAGAVQAPAPTAVVELYPHPAVTLGRVSDYRPILSVRQARDQLRALGVDYLVLVRFSESLSRASASEFISEVLQKACGITSLIVGPDAAIGAGREACGESLVRLGESLGLHVQIAPFLLQEDRKISSSLIRQHLAQGSVDEAATCLGRYHELDGKVVRGDGRGRGIGFPTANIHTRQLVPGNGVYACWAEVDGQRFMTATNVGVAPTFRRQGANAEPIVMPRVEAHLLDFPAAPFSHTHSYGDIYGRRIKLSFVKRIRTEQRFNSAAELVQQIRHDVLEVRKILES